MGTGRLGRQGRTIIELNKASKELLAGVLTALYFAGLENPFREDKTGIYATK